MRNLRPPNNYSWVCLGDLNELVGQSEKFGGRINTLTKTTLLNLFKFQQNLLNFFFNNIDHSQTLAFTCTLLHSTNTIFFFGIDKSSFIAQEIFRPLSPSKFDLHFYPPSKVFLRHVHEFFKTIRS
ncbi:putative arabinose 5-phosphate isomerase [Senna tora]|uniref:Putative arabinose 5-phosphate isomerase n=1 Tax=Senna tora TaxID=362788 RepID=A0A834XAB6_9FABA|nr:putative arabinose 5-phosphate isomerase [Senna tora]